MNRQEVMELAKELSNKPQICLLATISEEGLPEIRALENMRYQEKYDGHFAKVIAETEENPLAVYMSTNTSSEKIKQINKNDNVAIYFCIPKEYKGVMLQGNIATINDMEFKKKIWHDCSLKFYPSGYTDPDFTLLKLTPKHLKVWYKGIHELEL